MFRKPFLMLFILASRLVSASTEPCKFYSRESDVNVKWLMAALPPEGVGLVLCGNQPASAVKFYTFKVPRSNDQQITDFLSRFAKKIILDFTSTVVVDQAGSSGQRRKFVMKVDRGPDMEPWLFFAYLTPVKNGEMQMFVHYSPQTSVQRSLAHIQGRGLSLTSHGTDIR